MITKEFVLGGHAVFTAESPKGVHFTYRVTKKEFKDYRDDQPLERAYTTRTLYFIAVLTGPENTHDYTYMGVLDPVHGVINRTRATRFSDEAQCFKVARWVTDVLWRKRIVPAGYDLHHEGKCGRCGRALTVPESVKSGIGPECAKHLSGVLL